MALISFVLFLNYFIKQNKVLNHERPTLNIFSPIDFLFSNTTGILSLSSIFHNRTVLSWWKSNSLLTHCSIWISSYFVIWYRSVNVISGIDIFKIFPYLVMSKEVDDTVTRCWCHTILVWFKFKWFMGVPCLVFTTNKKLWNKNI